MTAETNRVEAFSDGVFAIAMTLLILEIKIPPAGSGELASQLMRQWPAYFSFLVSFAFIGIMWINHHRLFTHIARCDDMLLVLNLLLLLGVCVVPFPTAVLAVHLGQSDQRPALILYSATYVFIAIVFNGAVEICVFGQAAPPGERCGRCVGGTNFTSICVRPRFLPGVPRFIMAERGREFRAEFRAGLLLCAATAPGCLQAKWSGSIIIGSKGIGWSGGQGSLMTRRVYKLIPGEANRHQNNGANAERSDSKAQPF